MTILDTLQFWMKGFAGLLISLTIVGCSFRSIPTENVDFRRAESLKEFEGAFRNLGNIDPELPARVYLSALIWPTDAIAHGAITSIEVLAVDEDTLTVRALREDVVEKESSFIRGRDFKVREGRIILDMKWNLLSSGSGDVLVGPRYEKMELGIDARGDGKYRARGAAAGLVFLVWPVAFSSFEEVRFVRIR